MFEILKNLSMRKALVTAILLRILIMPFYFHPDIKTFNFQASFLKQGVFNIYDYLSLNKNKLSLKDDFVYFPLTYYFLGGYQIISSPLLGSGFDKWLADAGTNAAITVGSYRYLFILKFPYLVLDIAIGFLLSGLFLQSEDKKKVFIFWLFNPLSIILLYIYSNVDIFPTFLTVLSLYFAKKNKFIFAGFALGLGAAFKAYPLLLVPFLLLRTNNLKDRILILFISIGTFGLTILPFVKSAAFKQSTLASGLTTRIVSNGLDLSFGEILMPAIVLLAILFFWGMEKMKTELWKFYLVSFLIIFSSIHFHIQWLLWLLPFGIILFATQQRYEKKLLVFFLMVATLIPLLYNDKFMTIGLLKAISPLYELLPTPYYILGKIYKVEIIQGVLHSVLFGLGIILSLKILSKE